jgi:FtsH-binding integral membrane protein
MTQNVAYRQMGTTARGEAHTLFSQTMGYVAVTAALFAAGAWLGRDLTGGVGIVAFIAAIAALFGMRFAAKRSVPLTIGLLAAFGLLIGLAVAPTISYYGSMDPAPCGRRAGRPRCSSPASALRATPPGGIWPRSPGCASGLWWP